MRAFWSKPLAGAAAGSRQSPIQEDRAANGCLARKTFKPKEPMAQGEPVRCDGGRKGADTLAAGQRAYQPIIIFRGTRNGSARLATVKE